MTLARAVKSAGWIVGIHAIAGCGWDYLDAIGPAAGGETSPIQDASSDVMAMSNEGGADASGDGVGADVLAAEAGTADTEGPLDAVPADVAGPSDDSSVDGSSSSVPCTGSPAVVRQWTFDSDSQSWVFSMNMGVQGRVSWNGMGNPAPGSLEVDVAPGSSAGGVAKLAWARYNAMALGDLSGRTISAWLWLDTGVSPQVKLFVLTGNQYAWADNGAVTLAPNTWTCMSMAVSTPAYNGPGFDPTSVVAIGFEMADSAPFRILIDTVRYY